MKIIAICILIFFHILSIVEHGIPLVHSFPDITRSLFSDAFGTTGGGVDNTTITVCLYFWLGLTAFTPVIVLHDRIHQFALTEQFQRGWSWTTDVKHSKLVVS